PGVEWMSGVVVKRLGFALASFALLNLASLCLWPAVADAQLLMPDLAGGGAERVTEGAARPVEEAASTAVDDGTRTLERTASRTLGDAVERTRGSVEDTVERTSETVEDTVERTSGSVGETVERTSGTVERTSRRTVDTVTQSVERRPRRVAPPAPEGAIDDRKASPGPGGSPKVASGPRRVSFTARRRQSDSGATRRQGDRRELEAEDDTGAVAAAGDEVKTPAVAGIRIQAERPRPEAAPGGVLAMTGSSLLLLAALGLFNILFGTGGLALGRRRGVVSVAAMPGLGWATRARRPIRSKGWWFRSGSHR
ncbi:MAG: hypothetical protein ACRDJ5_04690, partial [Actinomycetota bacterium]